MQPYYVPSTAALKKRIKQFHNELKKHTPVSLGWCRDFTAKILFWDSWNSLHLAHEKPLNHDQHRRKLFGRDYMHTHEEVRNLQHATKNSLASELPNLSEIAIVTCAETLWYQRAPSLTLPASKKMSVEHVPDEYWMDNTYICADSEEAYCDFILKALLPVVARNGGVLFCSENECATYLSALSSQADNFNVLNLAIYDNDIPFGNYPGAQCINVMFNADISFWEQFGAAWRSALQNAGITDESIDVNLVARAIRQYYQILLGDNTPDFKVLYRLLKDERGFEHLPEMLERSLPNKERALLIELQRLIGQAGTSSVSLRTPIHNAHNALMDYCDERATGVPVTINELRSSTSPLLIICPVRNVKVCSNGYIAGIIDLLCMHIRDYGFKVCPSGHPRDNKPPRLLVMPYNGLYSPNAFGFTTTETMMAGWGLVSGGHPDVGSWNCGSNRTCLATYMANVGNFIEIKQGKTLPFFGTRSKIEWRSYRHLKNGESKGDYSHLGFGKPEYREAHYHAINLSVLTHRS
jgi:hypothetical protein